MAESTPAPNRRLTQKHGIVEVAGSFLNRPAFVLLQDSGDGGQEVCAGKLEVNAVLRPVAEEAKFVTVLEPVGDLFDGGLFEVRWERRLAWAGGIAGKDVAAGVS